MAIQLPLTAEGTGALQGAQGRETKGAAAEHVGQKEQGREQEAETCSADHADLGGLGIRGLEGRGRGRDWRTKPAGDAFDTAP